MSEDGSRDGGDGDNSSKIGEWRAIVTLIVFIITNIVVLFPFHVPIYAPRVLTNAVRNGLAGLRVLPLNETGMEDGGRFVRLRFPLNIVTAPLIADLFLLAIRAIGGDEVRDGTIGVDNIKPYDLMLFFITLAYIAISIDASGLIRFLAFKVLQWGGKLGHRLFFYLYAFFFALGTFIGNDPIILSGTAFLAYMTRVSSNIMHPRAWIFSQFAVANIASAVLVSSNPTNLVLAGAFRISFVDYTAMMIVPVLMTAIVLFPFLLYIVFADEALIPMTIKMHELSEEARAKKPVNPNIPHARATADDVEDCADEQTNTLSLEEIMNPFLDRRGALFGGFLMMATLATILALNAAKTKIEHGELDNVYIVTVPAAFIMFVWDLSFGWLHRHETREIARRGRQEMERNAAEKAVRERDEGIVGMWASRVPGPTGMILMPNGAKQGPSPAERRPRDEDAIEAAEESAIRDSADSGGGSDGRSGMDERVAHELELRKSRRRTTVASLAADAYRWLQETFPTAMAVLSHLPFVLVPFAFSMFILVQALVTKGWVEVFAHGWDNWVRKTGDLGAIGGMGFLSVVMCNFSGTNIGATILLSRVIQTWRQIHEHDLSLITNRMFWGTVYSMAIGVNYGAFSTAISASLAGLLWRDILAKKHIRIRRLDFARVNLHIIVIAMTVGCAVLTGEVYLFCTEDPYIHGERGSCFY